jgi:hypothetical protein
MYLRDHILALTGAKNVRLGASEFTLGPTGFLEDLEHE